MKKVLFILSLITVNAIYSQEPDTLSKDFTIRDSALKKSDIEAFNEAQKINMHYAYSDFINAYSNSELVSKARNKLTQFKRLTVPKPTFISFNTFRSVYHWNGVEILSRWSDGVAGMEIDEKGRQIFSGPVCWGNIQFEGCWTDNSNGILLFKGASIIYPIKK